MSKAKRRAENIMKLSLLIGTTILMHLLLTPLAYTKSLEQAAGRQYNPFTLSRDAYFINEGKNYELLSDIRIKSILGRNLSNCGRLLNRVLDTALQPVLTYLIFLIYSLTYYKKVQRRRSLLALSLGGHAPPE